jgi:hypothetical protein
MELCGRRIASRGTAAGKCVAAQLEWYAHVRLALQAGVAQKMIEAIGARREPVFSDPDEQLVYDFCSARAE